MLEVKNGGLPSGCRLLLDHNLDDFPDLSPDDRNYERRREFRNKMHRENSMNALQRATMIVEDYDALYAAARACTEQTAPMLYRSLPGLCLLDATRVDPDNLAHGHYDYSWLNTGYLRSKVGNTR